MEIDEESYIPKHAKRYYSSGMSHCCFSGCNIGGCGCCVNMPFHESSCENNPSRMMDEAEHDIYVGHGLRQHIKNESVEV